MFRFMFVFSSLLPFILIQGTLLSDFVILFYLAFFLGRFSVINFIKMANERGKKMKTKKEAAAKLASALKANPKTDTKINKTNNDEYDDGHDGSDGGKLCV